MGFAATDQLDETDLRLIHAVQLAPRAPWTLIAAACGIHPVTAARRWERLSGEGLAWVTATPGPALLRRLTVAFIEVSCAPQHRDSTVAALCDNPRIASVEIVSSERDLFLTALTTGLDALSELVLDQINRMPGVRNSRVHVATEMFGEASKWRVAALDPSESRQLSGATPTGPASAQIAAAHQEVFTALVADGRIPTAKLADQLGISAGSAARLLDRMTRSGVLALRCDVAQSAVGMPVPVTLLCRTHPSALVEVGTAIGARPEMRLCAGVAADTNLLMTVWLRSINDSQRLETELVAQEPRLAVLGRIVTLRMPKRMGHLLNAKGRAIRSGPLDPWAVS